MSFLNPVTFTGVTSTVSATATPTSTSVIPEIFDNTVASQLGLLPTSSELTAQIEQARQDAVNTVTNAVSGFIDLLVNGDSSDIGDKPTSTHARPPGTELPGNPPTPPGGGPVDIDVTVGPEGQEGQLGSLSVREEKVSGSEPAIFTDVPGRLPKWMLKLVQETQLTPFVPVKGLDELPTTAPELAQLLKAMGFNERKVKELDYETNSIAEVTTWTAGESGEQAAKPFVSFNFRPEADAGDKAHSAQRVTLKADGTLKLETAILGGLRGMVRSPDGKVADTGFIPRSSWPNDTNFRRTLVQLSQDEIESGLVGWKIGEVRLVEGVESSSPIWTVKLVSDDGTLELLAVAKESYEDRAPPFNEDGTPIEGDASRANQGAHEQATYLFSKLSGLGLVPVTVQRAFNAEEKKLFPGGLGPGLVSLQLFAWNAVGGPRDAGGRKPDPEALVRGKILETLVMKMDGSFMVGFQGGAPVASAFARSLEIIEIDNGITMEGKLGEFTEDRLEPRGVAKRLGLEEGPLTEQDRKVIAGLDPAAMAEAVARSGLFLVEARMHVAMVLALKEDPYLVDPLKYEAGPYGETLRSSVERILVEQRQVIDDLLQEWGFNSKGAMGSRSRLYEPPMRQGSGG
jgi:hypothetical protein